MTDYQKRGLRVHEDQTELKRLQALYDEQKKEADALARQMDETARQITIVKRRLTATTTSSTTLISLGSGPHARCDEIISRIKQIPLIDPESIETEGGAINWITASIRDLPNEKISLVLEEDARCYLLYNHARSRSADVTTWEYLEHQILNECMRLNKLRTESAITSNQLVAETKKTEMKAQMFHKIIDGASTDANAIMMVIDAVGTLLRAIPLIEASSIKIPCQVSALERFTAVHASIRNTLSPRTQTPMLITVWINTEEWICGIQKFDPNTCNGPWSATFVNTPSGLSVMIEAECIRLQKEYPAKNNISNVKE